MTIDFNKGNGRVPAIIQDDYAIMIIETIPMQLDVDHKANDL